MTTKVRSVLFMAVAVLFLCRAGVAAIADDAASFLSVLADTKPNGVVIAVGNQPASQEAARIIREAIRRLPGQADWDNIVPADEFDARPFAETGQVHVIAVGTLADNVVLQGRSWLPAWWMDWDWYTTRFPLRLTEDRIGLPYQPTTGFTAAGYGHWNKGQGGVGLIEVDRSHLFMEWIVRSRIEDVSGGPVPGSGDFRKVQGNLKNRGPVPGHAAFTSAWPVYPKDFPLRLLVRITGTGPEGLKAAATAFAGQRMLSGVVLVLDTPAGEGPAQATLPVERYTDRLPFTPPAGADGFTYLGWLLPDAFEYDGLLADTGVRPVRMFRLKYMPESGITSFWTTPHRRAGEFEIACLKFTDAASAKRAADAIAAAARGLQPFKDGRVTNWGVAVSGPIVYLRSMVDPAGSQILEACSKLPAW
jgi:hypothetical protein